MVRNAIFLLILQFSRDKEFNVRLSRLLFHKIRSILNVVLVFFRETCGIFSPCLSSFDKQTFL